MTEELFSRFQPHRGLEGPPPSPIKLWCEGGRGVWIADKWGPAIPYGPIDHGDGHQNHGFRRLKGDAEAVYCIPEVAECPELMRLLQAINTLESPIESVGCEKAFFPTEGPGEATVYLGAYIDVIFTDAVLNDRPDNILLLASHLLEAIKGCEKWWANVSMVLQRMRSVPGATAPWGLMLHISNHGRSSEEARKFWAVTAERLAKAIAVLPRNFRLRANQSSLETQTEDAG